MSSASVPLLPPGQLGDREKLMQHISTLSAALARLQLQLSAASGTGVELSVDPAALDAAAAAAEVQRLNKLLAQQSLLQEAREGHHRAVEGERDALRGERQMLLEANAALEERADELEGKLASLAAQLQAADSLTSEVGMLRARERELTEALAVAHSSDPVVRIIRGGNPRSARSEGEAPVTLQSGTLRPDVAQEMDLMVVAAREALLLDAFFDPLREAFVAGAQWSLAQERWEEECITLRAAAQREHDEWEQQQQQRLAELQNASQHAEATALRSELEALRQQLSFIELERQRLERQVAAERQRLEAKSVLYHEAMVRVHEEVMEQRRALLEEVRGEMQAKVKEAFRSGCRHERQLRLAGHPAQLPPRGAGSAPSSVSLREDEGARSTTHSRLQHVDHRGVIGLARTTTTTTPPSSVERSSSGTECDID